MKTLSCNPFAGPQGIPQVYKETLMAAEMPALFEVEWRHR